MVNCIRCESVAEELCMLLFPLQKLQAVGNGIPEWAALMTAPGVDRIIDSTGGLGIAILPRSHHYLASQQIQA